MNTIIGTKQNMTSKYNELGHRMPVTKIVAEGNIVLGAKEDRLHLGFGRKKKFIKPENAFVTTVGYAPRTIKEIKITKGEAEKTFSKGDQVTVSIFEPGDIVKVTGVTKGRGFAGGVKRYNFRGGPKTHGQSDRHRAPGSIGQTTTPGRVFKGKRMAGHYGAVNITITGLVVVEVDETANAILVKGSVPGAKNGQLVIQKTGKMKNYSPLQSRESKAAKEAAAASEKVEDQKELEDKKITAEIQDAENQQEEQKVGSKEVEKTIEAAESVFEEPAVEKADEKSEEYQKDEVKEEVDAK